MHPPESLDNNGAKENEECGEEQGQQRHHFSPKGKICKQQSGWRVVQFLLEFQFPIYLQFPQKPSSFPEGLKDNYIFDHCPAPTQKEGKKN